MLEILQQRARQALVRLRYCVPAKRSLTRCIAADRRPCRSASLIASVRASCAERSSCVNGSAAPAATSAFSTVSRYSVSAPRPIVRLQLLIPPTVYRAWHHHAGSRVSRTRRMYSCAYGASPMSASFMSVSRRSNASHDRRVVLRFHTADREEVSLRLEAQLLQNICRSNGADVSAVGNERSRLSVPRPIVLGDLLRVRSSDTTRTGAPLGATPMPDTTREPPPEQRPPQRGSDVPLWSQSSL